jgi:hypothetical protein
MQNAKLQLLKEQNIGPQNRKNIAEFKKNTCENAKNVVK